MKKVIFSTLLSFILAATYTTGAFAAKPVIGGGTNTKTPLGIDISYPQCGKRLPSGQAFGIVGVNGGLANTSNPCFLEQLAWAQKSTGATSQPRAALYVNTANPGHAAKVWPNSNYTEYQSTPVSNPYGTCSGAEDEACAYMYGWTRAYEDAHIRNVPNPSSFKWWLDVETENSWSTSNLEANAASLEGMVDYFSSIGATVGIYSTNYQWETIVGTVDPASNLNGLDSWLAGALTQRGAEQNCHDTPLTPSSTVVLTQFVSKGLDYNVSCQ